MLYIFAGWEDEGAEVVKKVYAAVTVEPIKGEDNEAEFVIREENDGSLIHLLENDNLLMLGAKVMDKSGMFVKVESEDGRFDKHRLDHWAALPYIFHGSRFWVEELTGEEAEQYAKELGDKENDSEKGKHL